MYLEETIELPKEISEGWGMARDWRRPNIMFVSDGSNTIYECDVKQKFKVVKTHEVGLPAVRRRHAAR